MATEDLEQTIRNALGCTTLRFLKDVRGGIVNAGNARVYETEKEKIFVKCNSTKEGHQMFECEEESLRMIAATKTLRVPQPKQLVHCADPIRSTLITEYLQDLQPIDGDETWRLLGQHIARMHQHNELQRTAQLRKSSSVSGKASSPDQNEENFVTEFGFHTAHYFGPDFHIPPDIWEKTWQDYLSRQLFDRLICACQERFGDRELAENWASLSLCIDKPYRCLTIKPALLHGDLFDINVGQVSGQPVVFDPQSWYGYSEFELGDSLPETFLTGYRSVIPKPEDGGYTQREKIHELLVNILLYYCREEPEYNRKQALELFTSLEKELS